MTDNPKDAIGSTKLPVHLWPNIATAYGSIGMLEGATKYGRNNFIAAPVRAHIYVAAAMRHLMAWMEGEEFTEEGGPHLGNALATIAIILKARQHGTLIDDREYMADINDDAYGREVLALVDIGNKLKAKLEARMEKPPRHWDRRDAVPKPEKVIKPSSKCVVFDDTTVVLPPEAVLTDGDSDSFFVVYDGPAPADGEVTPMDSVESSLIRGKWRYEHVMLRRAILRANPALKDILVFGMVPRSLGRLRIAVLE